MSLWSRFLLTKWLWWAKQVSFCCFPLKYWIFPCLGLRRLIIKSNAAAVGQPVYNLTISGYFITYSYDNIGQEITWCWFSLELKGLLAIFVGWYSGVVEIDNGSSAILLSWVSDTSKSTFPVSLDNREISVNFEQVGSSFLLDENGESRSCSGSDGISCSCSFSYCRLLLSNGGSFLNIFFPSGGSFLEVGAFLLATTWASSS